MPTPGSIDHLFPSEASPGDGIVEADTIETILDGMDPRDRATLLLHAAGFSGAEIGQQLNGSPASARTRLSRARAQFREQYARLGAMTASTPDRIATPEGRPVARAPHLTLLRSAQPAPAAADTTAGESTDQPPSPRSGGTSA